MERELIPRLKQAATVTNIGPGLDDDRHHQFQVVRSGAKENPHFHWAHRDEHNEAGNTGSGSKEAARLTAASANDRLTAGRTPAAEARRGSPTE
jgi:hypothetical protein